MKRTASCHSPSSSCRSIAESTVKRLRTRVPSPKDGDAEYVRGRQEMQELLLALCAEEVQEACRLSRAAVLAEVEEDRRARAVAQAARYYSELYEGVPMLHTDMHQCLLMPRHSRSPYPFG